MTRRIGSGGVIMDRVVVHEFVWFCQFGGVGIGLLLVLILLFGEGVGLCHQILQQSRSSSLMGFDQPWSLIRCILAIDHLTE